MVIEPGTMMPLMRIATVKASASREMTDEVHLIFAPLRIRKHRTENQGTSRKSVPPQTSVAVPDWMGCGRKRSLPLRCVVDGRSAQVGGQPLLVETGTC
jgi:hypothetical protein